MCICYYLMRLRHLIVKYSKLFNLLLEREICSLIVRLLLNMYLISTAVVSWNGVNSDQFKLCNGVKQGSVISPIVSLFT